MGKGQSTSDTVTAAVKLNNSAIHNATIQLMKHDFLWQFHGNVTRLECGPLNYYINKR